MRVLAAGVLLSYAVCLPAYTLEASAHELLRQALAASAAHDEPRACTYVHEAVDGPEFSNLEPATQHAAFELGYRCAFNQKDFKRAQQLATRATALPQQSPEDWSYRLRGAAGLKDGRDEALSIASFVTRWGPESEWLTLDTIGQAYADTRSADTADARKAMLLALFDHGWRPEGGESASYLWRTLSLMLVEGGELAKAAQVVVLVDHDRDVIAIQADRRFERLRKVPYFEADPYRAAQRTIKQQREYWDRHPRSLPALVRLLNSLMDVRSDEEALALATQADRKIAGTGTPPFNDIEGGYPWLLNAKAKALRHLGRFDEGLTELRRASDLHSASQLSHAINLAHLLCELDRAPEALSVLPDDAQASDYGRTQIALVRLIVAQSQGDAASIRTQLDYLQAHAEISAATYEEALLLTGDLARAQQLLIGRLQDPLTRTQALLELQVYAQPRRPPRSQAWHAVREKLEATPEVRRAVAQVGSVNRYSWRYD